MHVVTPYYNNLSCFYIFFPKKITAIECTECGQLEIFAIKFVIGSTRLMNVLEIGDTEKNVGQNLATQIIENIS